MIVGFHEVCNIAFQRYPGSTISQRPCRECVLSNERKEWAKRQPNLRPIWPNHEWYNN